MSHPVLVGRKRECRLIADLMNQRKSIAVFGEEGVGKTAIMEELLRGRRSPVLYCENSRTLKEALVNLALSRNPCRSRVQKKPTQALKKICYGLLDQHPEYVVFDHMVWVEPKFYAFLIYLIERAIPLIIIARSLEKKTLGHLWMALYSFERVEIKNLDRPRTDELVGVSVKNLCLLLEAEARFKREVFGISRGNPKIATQLCWLAQNEKYRRKGYLDVQLMDLDRRIKGCLGCS